MNATRSIRRTVLLAAATVAVTISAAGAAQATPVPMTPSTSSEAPLPTPDESPPTTNSAISTTSVAPETTVTSTVAPETTVASTVAPETTVASTVAPETTVAPPTTTPPAAMATTTNAPTTTTAPAAAITQSLSVVSVSLPSAPQSPAATPGNATVKLTWLAPSSNGGATIDKYAVQRSLSSGGPWSSIATTTSLSYAAGGLTNGVHYYFRIVAHNTAGWGTPSSVVGAVPRTVPTAPQSAAATPGNHSVKLTWSAPSSNGGAAIDKYAVQRSTSSAGPWTNIAFPTTLSYTAIGLTNGTHYYFRIVAHNAAGWGPASSVVGATPRTVPSAPLSPTATPGNAIVKLAWVAASNGGAPVDKYAVQRATSAAGPWTNVGFPTTTLYTDGFLSNGTTYYFRILAHNAAGWSAPSTVVSAKPVTVPSAPASCSATQVSGPGTHAVSIQWTAPVSDGGAPIQFYIIHVDHYGTQVLADSTQYLSAIESLDFGYNYDVSVAAYNGQGYGVGAFCHAPILDMNP